MKRNEAKKNQASRKLLQGPTLPRSLAGPRASYDSDVLMMLVLESVGLLNRVLRL
jgi:hypothetical protein